MAVQKGRFGVTECVNCGYVYNPDRTNWFCPECHFKNSCCEGGMQ